MIYCLVVLVLISLIYKHLYFLYCKEYDVRCKQFVENQTVTMKTTVVMEIDGVIVEYIIE